LALTEALSFLRAAITVADGWVIEDSESGGEELRKSPVRFSPAADFFNRAFGRGDGVAAGLSRSEAALCGSVAAMESAAFAAAFEIRPFLAALS
jgi:hypothetical protein